MARHADKHESGRVLKQIHTVRMAQGYGSSVVGVPVHSGRDIHKRDGGGSRAHRIGVGLRWTDAPPYAAS